MGAETVRVYVTPRAGTDEVVGMVGGVVRLRVAAPPVDGRANDAVERLLARTLGVPTTAVAVVGGKTARHKTVTVMGWSAERVLAAIGAATRPARSPAE